MKRICAWCQVTLELAEVDKATSSDATHGICEACQDQLLGVKRHVFNDFLDSFPQPVFLVNAEGTILTANETAQHMLGKALPDIENFPGGVVFECVNAALPGGCGNTVHCVGCMVRNTVMRTFDTGQPALKVPASLETHTGEIDFYISTIRANDYVLLRVDAVNPVS